MCDIYIIHLFPITHTWKYTCLYRKIYVDSIHKTGNILKEWMTNIFLPLCSNMRAHTHTHVCNATDVSINVYSNTYDGVASCSVVFWFSFCTSFNETQWCLQEKLAFSMLSRYFHTYCDWQNRQKSMSLSRNEVAVIRCTRHCVFPLQCFFSFRFFEASVEALFTNQTHTKTQGLKL